MKKEQDHFEKPRHWVDLEELNAEYWQDPVKMEKRGQEFYDKPIETLETIERLDTKGLARREFLTVMGASMALASTACMKKPVHKIIPYVVRPEEIQPGVATWYASTCGECSRGCGIVTKNREGRPIKLEGNIEHPVNEGALCARGQGSLLNLYDPERLKTPVALNKGNGSASTLTWEQLDEQVIAKLKSIVEKGGNIRILSGEVSSPSTRRLITEFLDGFKNSAHIEFEPLSDEDVALGQEESYGSALIPQYDFAKADVIVSIGADFLGTWVSPVEFAAAWAKKRKLDSKKHTQATLSKSYCFEAGFTITGSNADERYPIRAGDESKIALALAHHLVVTKKLSRFANDGQIARVLSGYSSEAVASDVGGVLTAEIIRQCAEDLWKARGKALVVAGGGSVETQVAVNLLNSLLDSEGQAVSATGAVTFKQTGLKGVKKLISEMNAGFVDALILYRANPVYELPASLGFADALKKVGLATAFVSHVDETARLTDYALNDHHYLENWGDSQARSNVVSIQQPAVSPLHSSRSFQDSLIVWAKGVGLKTSGLLAKTQNGWYDYLKDNWKENYYSKFGLGQGSFNAFWENTLEKGILKTNGGYVSPRSFKTSAFNGVAQFKKSAPLADDEVYLHLYSKISMGDGRSANNAWLQEMPDPITSATWDNYLNLAPQTAENLKVKLHDVVSIDTGSVKVELPVHIQPGMHPGGASAAVGYGRASTGQVGKGVGSNVFGFADVSGDSLGFSAGKVKIKKTGKRYEIAITQGHFKTENRPIINDITLAAFQKDPATENHTDPHLRMKDVPTLWPKHVYNKPYRWGMAIDLNSCTGCGACVIACQAENNIPVVGREQVRKSREMHWIRIDRYYSGHPENPQVVHQPMLCQHCENAHCETVCPVLATVHNDEGLNEMVYNRCVGTRYCQNNCAYKVRRFNFFDHWKEYKDTLNLVWNPDVTVRTRGVMEKCTFCVQRINEAKGRAKDENRLLKDGELKTACQQTCPTEAIVFGNINDSESRVSQLRDEQRAFRVLEITNSKPSIFYLTKVRNNDFGAHEEKHHGNEGEKTHSPHEEGDAHHG